MCKEFSLKMETASIWVKIKALREYSLHMGRSLCFIEAVYQWTRKMPHFWCPIAHEQNLFSESKQQKSMIPEDHTISLQNYQVELWKHHDKMAHTNKTSPYNKNHTEHKHAAWSQETKLNMKHLLMKFSF